MDIGEKVRILRQRQGLFQKKLAEECSVNQAMISRIETGKVRAIKPELLLKLSEIFGVSVGYLVGDEEGFSGNDEPDGDSQLKFFFNDFFSLNPDQRAEVVSFTSFTKAKAESKDE